MYLVETGLRDKIRDFVVCLASFELKQVDRCYIESKRKEKGVIYLDE